MPGAGTSFSCICTVTPWCLAGSLASCAWQALSKRGNSKHAALFHSNQGVACTKCARPNTQGHERRADQMSAGERVRLRVDALRRHVRHSSQERVALRRVAPSLVAQAIGSSPSSARGGVRCDLQWKHCSIWGAEHHLAGSNCSAYRGLLKSSVLARPSVQRWYQKLRQGNQFPG